jgi:hypothetical protein
MLLKSVQKEEEKLNLRIEDPSLRFTQYIELLLGL